MRSFILTALLASSIFSTTESSQLLRGETTETALLSRPLTERELREDNEYLDAIRNRREYAEILENGGGATNNFARIVGGNNAQAGEYPYYVEMGGCGTFITCATVGVACNWIHFS